MAKKDIIKRKKGEIIHEAKIDEKESFSQINKIVLGIIITLFFLFLLLIKIFS